MKSNTVTSVRLPDFIEPMKAKLVGSMPLGDYIYEIKFDGYRALALRGGSETRLLSRNQKDLGGKFPEYPSDRRPGQMDTIGRRRTRWWTSRASFVIFDGDEEARIGCNVFGRRERIGNK